MEACRADASLRRQIETEKNPYVIKVLVKKIKLTDEWCRKSSTVLEALMKAKFDQHPTLKNKLLSYPTGNFYEATKDPKYGCGFFLNE